MWEIAKFARYPNRNILYVAPTYKQAKSIIWDDLINKLTEKKWARKINHSELTVILRNNSIISLRSADNFDSMRGISCDFLVMDECSDIDPKTWTEVLRPTLSDTGGHALFISTPKGFNWFKDLYESAFHLNDWGCYQYTTLDGCQVPAGEIEAAKRDLDEKTFRQEYMATFETYSGVIYYNFNYKQNVKSYKNNNKNEYHIGIDFNVDPICSVIAKESNGVLHIIDEKIIHGSNTDELAEVLREDYAGKLFAYPDPSGSRRQTSARGRSDHIILGERGLIVKSHPAHPRVKDRINAVNRLLCDASGQRRLLIDPGCKKTIEALQKHQYKAGSQVPDKDTGYDHITDALGYMIEYLYPVKKTPNTGRREVFGHW